jgi:glyoxylase-like metal-dependent hydrolase (beta-lactamase superfamily II)
MAVMIGWARVLIAGDYLSAVELPSLGDGGSAPEYLATLERLRPLVARAEHVVPGHGPVLDRARALQVLEEDAAYLGALIEDAAGAVLPESRRTPSQRRLHEANLARL